VIGISGVRSSCSVVVIIIDSMEIFWSALNIRIIGCFLRFCFILISRAPKDGSRWLGNSHQLEPGLHRVKTSMSPWCHALSAHLSCQCSLLARITTFPIAFAEHHPSSHQRAQDNHSLTTCRCSHTRSIPVRICQVRLLGRLICGIWLVGSVDMHG
jgi:hypothetical protein